MMRAIGFVSGVGLTVAAFLLVLDGRYNPPADTLTGLAGDPTPEQLSEVFESIAEQVDVVPDEHASDAAVAPDPEFAPTDRETQSGFDLSVPDPEHHPDMQAVPPESELASAEGDAAGGFETPGTGPEQRLDRQAQADTSDRADGGDAGIHLFWSPFRSEWSAQGFARRLSSATQVPVEVVNAAPGQYRVAFSYQDETERLARIEQIEAITGLKQD